MSKWKNKLKESRLIKGTVYSLVGAFSYPGLNMINRLEIKGMEQLRELPRSNVLFVSNHQTYFAEVIALLHVFCAVSWGKKRKLGFPFYLLWPYIKVNFVSAEETMKKSLMNKFFALAGSIMVKRVWVQDGKETRKGLDPSDTRKIFQALDKNWVITFPQGTTTPFAPGRKGTAFIIKQHRPIVIPIVVDGFSEAFEKKGLKLKNKKTKLSITFKPPMVIDYEQSNEEILEQVMDAIEQSKKFMPEKN